MHNLRQGYSFDFKEAKRIFKNYLDMIPKLAKTVRKINWYKFEDLMNLVDDMKKALRINNAHSIRFFMDKIQECDLSLLIEQTFCEGCPENHDIGCTYERYNFDSWSKKFTNQKGE